MTRLVVGAVALLFALAGCGGDDPKAEPSSTPSTPVTTPASTTPSPPVMPEAAKADTKAGAIAFVRHYVELVNHAQVTGELDGLRAVEERSCGSCKAARQGLQIHYESGGSIRGGDWTIDSLHAVHNEAISGWVVDAEISFGDQVVSFGSSEPDDVNEGGRMVISVQVRGAATGWKVLEWTRGG